MLPWWSAIPLPLLLLGSAGCSPFPVLQPPSPGVSPAPSRPWVPPAGADEAEPSDAGEVPGAGLLPAPPLPGQMTTLAELIDLGLARQPDTREAWLSARAAAARLEAERGPFWPQAALTGNATRSRSAVSGGAASGPGVGERTTLAAGVELSWLLLDFGGRRAAVEQARQALLAADWTHDAVITDRVLAITAAFHVHQAALSLVEAGQAALKEAQAGLAAAEERRRAGVATLAEVLQARTALSRAELNLQTYMGRAATSRGELCAATALPVDTELMVEPLPAELPLAQVEGELQQYLADARARRPELAAAVASARGAEARVDAVRAAGLPTLVAGGSAGPLWFTDPWNRVLAYSGGLTLRFPLFTGFAQRHEEEQARLEAEAARTRVEALRQQVELEVFRSYQDAVTAAQQVRTARELVTSAQQAEETALGRYQAGAGSILELLASQSALEDARAQEVQARTGWLIALARLARARGMSPVPAAGKGTP